MKLIKETFSLCPECLQTVPAKIIEKRGKIIIQKRCQKHGVFEDAYFGDASLYYEYMRSFQTKEGVKNPNTRRRNGCPFDCGLCPNHKSSTILALIDVTNRCNMRCPICFANANAAGYVYEPTVKQIKKMLDVVAKEKPRCYAVMFAGGEPTVRDDLPKIVKIARNRGFKEILIATNGLRLAKDIDYLRKLAKAGTNTLYLQFDGVTKEPYIVARGFNALPIKEKVIKNVRKVNKECGRPNVVLVPTVVRGVNDQQVGDIIRFAMKNNDVVAGVNFQPVSFAGRINKSELKKKRITIPDLLHDIEEQTYGQIKASDFVTIPAITPLIDFLKRTQKGVYPELSTHPACGAGTYVYVNGDQVIPITRLINVKRLLEVSEHSKGKMDALARLFINAPSIIYLDKIKESKSLLSLLKDIIVGGDFASAARFHKQNILFIGTMHFMDPYNFDVERVERCVIHYVTPDHKIIPFCSYNSLHRSKFEKKFSREIKEDERFEGFVHPEYKSLIPKEKAIKV
ncbi:MAG: radical SAM protein [Candidatus Diapherotrites archaeon]|nr:radical SAM protein [Candidatus Diapherotrites archaeon]